MAIIVALMLLFLCCVLSCVVMGQTHNPGLITLFFVICTFFLFWFLVLTYSAIKAALG